MIKVKKDLTGKTFGRLTVIKQAEDHVRKNGRIESQWLCKCDCGNIIPVRTHSLTSGHTKSCGCLQKEIAKTTKKKYNTYDLTGEYGIGYTSKGEEFYFDLEDYDKIKDYCWCVDKYGYVRGNVYKTKIKLHRLITDCHKDMVVDHINHNKLDNRKNNLRICDQHRNNMNRSLLPSNTSGVTGVTFDKSKNKWSAQIGYKGKNIYLGRFDFFEDAVKARKEAEEKYFGEYSYDNSVKK